MAEKKIILGVQYLRGLAALGVVLCHYGAQVNNTFIADLLSYGQLGVLVFFLISGFIILHSLTSSGYQTQHFFRFLIKRQLRIGPPYYVTIILTLLLFGLLSLIPTFKGTAIPFIPNQFLAHVFYLVPFTKYPFYNHVFWTLCVEFQFYVLTGLLYFLVDHAIYRTTFLIIFCASAFIPMHTGYYFVFTYAPVFCLGMSMVQLVNNRHRFSYLLPILFALVVLIKYPASTACILLMSTATIICVTKYNKTMFWLGEISYSLYLTHPLVYIVTNGVIKRLGFNVANNQLIWLPLQLLIAVLFAHFFYQLIEKPALRYSKQIFYKPASTSK